MIVNRFWHADWQARLVELAGAGKTTREIAYALNIEFRLRLTRNAIIGRCRRTGVALDRVALSPGMWPRATVRRLGEHKIY